MATALFDSLNSLIYSTAQQILTEGSVVKPRGMETREIMSWTASLTDPRNRACTLKGRKWDPSFCIAETLWYLRGSNMVDEMSFWAPHITAYSDDKVVFHGAYGYRVFKVFNTFQAALDKLRVDPDSRQAVVPIFEPRDTFQRTKDLPCTLCWHFMIRNGKLDMVVDMRSNDLFTGTTNDLFAFTMIQEWAARQLGIDAGRYFHHSHSMHLYLDKVEKVGQWASLPSSEAWVEVPPMIPMPDVDDLNLAIQKLQVFESDLRGIVQEVNQSNAKLSDLCRVIDAYDSQRSCEWQQSCWFCLALGALKRVKVDKLDDNEAGLIKGFCGKVQSLIVDLALRTSTIERYGNLMEVDSQ